MILAISLSLGAVLSTVAGGSLVLSRQAWVKRHIWRFLAFGSGTLLGITFLHLLPEAWELNPRWAGGAVLAAFILFFTVEEFTVVHPCSEIAEDCHVHSLGYGAFVALFLHSMADGLAMAFSFLESTSLGWIVSVAVIVHKFSDGLTLSSLLRAAGHPTGRTAFLMIVLALATPLGVGVGFMGAGRIGPTTLACLLGLAAGGFLYVSTADILPRLHRTRDAICWVFLALGVSVSFMLRHH